MLAEKTAYQVKTEAFEGPLDVLLELIEKRKLFINDISLAKVTDDFIEYVKRRAQFPFPEIADFILIASTLLLIKSKSLLPILELSEEEEGSMEELERRLKEYKKIKELSMYVKDIFGKKIIFMRAGRFIEPIFSPSMEINLQSLFNSAGGVLASFPIPEKLVRTTVKKVISLEEAIEQMIERISKSIKLSFQDLSQGNKEKNKTSIIVSFLALLELVKRGLVETDQQEHFGDIEISNNRL